MQKDEIKEILEDIKGIYYFKPLLDYITNLQEENKELLEETSKLTELWLKEKEKNRKVIEYLEAPNRDKFDYCKAYMIEILQGKSDKGE